MRHLRQKSMLRGAAVLQLLQGALMECGVFVAFLVLSMLGVDQDAAGRRFEFIVPWLQEHLYLMMAISGVFGLLRIVAAVGLLRNRMWGLSLSVIMCATTLVLMVFMLPAGIADGLLSGAALVLILMAWHGTAPILTDDRHERVGAGIP